MDWPIAHTNISITINFHAEPVLVNKGESEYEMTPASELMCIHQKLNHLAFMTIQLMAANGIYAKRLIGCCVLLQCSVCLYGKAPVVNGTPKCSKGVPISYALFQDSASLSIR